MEENLSSPRTAHIILRQGSRAILPILSGLSAVVCIPRFIILLMTISIVQHHLLPDFSEVENFTGGEGGQAGAITLSKRALE